VNEEPDEGPGGVKQMEHPGGDQQGVPVTEQASYFSLSGILMMIVFVFDFCFTVYKAKLNFVCISVSKMPISKPHF